MKSSNRGHLIFILALSLFVVILLAASFQYQHNLRIIPVVVAIPTLVLLTAILIKNRSPRTEERVEAKDANTGFAVRIMGWMVLFSVAILFLGFFVSVPLFVFVFLLTEAELRWSASMVSSLIITVSFLIIFSLGLKIPLWPGLIPELLPKVLGGGLLPPL